MKIRCYALLLFLFIVCTGCTVQQFASKKPVMFASFEDFQFGPKGGVDLVWSTKRITDEISLRSALQKYDSMALDQALVVVDKMTADTLDEKQILRISRQLAKEIKERFGRWYKFVEVPTENTLRLSIVLTRSESSKPFFAKPGSPFPAGSETSIVAMIVADEDAMTGNLMAELLVSDAKSNEPLIATIDKQFGDQDIGAMINSQEASREVASQLVERFWTTLYYWNWIKRRTPSA